MDSNKHVKLSDLRMSRTSTIERANSPNLLNSSKKEPNENVKSPNFQLDGTSVIKNTESAKIGLRMGIKYVR